MKKERERYKRRKMNHRLILWREEGKEGEKDGRKKGWREGREGREAEREGEILRTTPAGGKKWRGWRQE